MRAAERCVGAAMCLAFAAGTFSQEGARNRVDPVQDTDEMQHMDHARHDELVGPKADPSPHRAADMEHADRSKEATGAEAPTALLRTKRPGQSLRLASVSMWPRPAAARSASDGLFTNGRDDGDG